MDCDARRPCALPQLCWYARAVARCTSRMAIPTTRFRQPAFQCKKYRNRFGNTTSHCCTATAKNTCSTKCAAVSTMHRVLQAAHTPRPLHECATRNSNADCSQSARANPDDPMPRYRYLVRSRSTYAETRSILCGSSRCSNTLLETTMSNSPQRISNISASIFTNNRQAC